MQSALEEFEEWPSSAAPSTCGSGGTYRAFEHLAFANNTDVATIRRLFEDIRIVGVEDFSCTDLLRHFLDTHVANVVFDSLIRVKECRLDSHGAINALRDKYEILTNATNVEINNSSKVFVVEVVPPVRIEWRHDGLSSHGHMFASVLRSDSSYNKLLLRSPLIKTRGRFLGFDLPTGSVVSRLSARRTAHVRDSRGNILISFISKNGHCAVDIASSMILDQLVQDRLPRTEAEQLAAENERLQRDCEIAERNTRLLREAFKRRLAIRNDHDDDDAIGGISNDDDVIGGIGNDVDGGLGESADGQNGFGGSNIETPGSQSNQTDNRRVLDQYW